MLTEDEWRRWGTPTIAQEQMKSKRGKSKLPFRLISDNNMYHFLQPKFSEWVSVAGVDVSGVEEVVNSSGSVGGSTDVVPGWSHVGLGAGRSE